MTSLQKIFSKKLVKSEVVVPWWPICVRCLNGDPTRSVLLSIRPVDNSELLSMLFSMVQSVLLAVVPSMSLSMMKSVIFIYGKVCVVIYGACICVVVYGALYVVIYVAICVVVYGAIWVVVYGAICVVVYGAINLSSCVGFLSVAGGIVLSYSLHYSIQASLFPSWYEWPSIYYWDEMTEIIGIAFN